MSSSGLKTGDFTNLNVTYGVGVGTRRDNGISGQILTSGGTDKAMTWDDTGVSEVDAGDGIIVTSTTNPAGDKEKIIKTHIDNDTITYKAGSPTQIFQVAKVPNPLTAGIGVSFSTGTTYDGSTAITINGGNPVTHYNWWADKTTPGFRKTPTTFATGITYSNLYFNGGTTGDYVSMRYTMPAGSRYFKITLDFQFVWEQPLFTGTYYPHIAYVRLVDDTTGADITLTNGAVTETTISVVNTAPLNTTAGDPVQTASISWIYDYGSTLLSDTEKVFRPQFANWFFDTTTTSGTMRDFLVLSKATTITGGSSAFQTNEFCGMIEDLGSSYVANTNKPSPSLGA